MSRSGGAQKETRRPFKGAPKHEEASGNVVTFAHGLHEDGVVAGDDEAETALVSMDHYHSRWRAGAAVAQAAVHGF